MNAPELLKMPYHQRRIIVVVNDAPPSPRPSRAITPAVRIIAESLVSPLALQALDLYKARREMRQGGESLVKVS